MHCNPVKFAKRIIAARKRGDSPQEIQDMAIEFGLPREKVDEAVEIVENAFKRGIQSAITSGMSDQDLRHGEDPLVDAAFRLGRAEMKWTSGFPLLVKLGWPILLTLMVVAFLVYYLCSR